MAVPLATVGQKITATIWNVLVAAVNAAAAGGSSIVTPTSVAGGTLTGARVTFTAASTVSVNGCFTATYDNYTIEMVFTHSAATSTTMRMRLAGTDNSAANYDLQTLTGASASASAAQVLAATSWGLSGVNSAQENVTILLNSPALAVATEGHSVNRATQNPLTTSGTLGNRLIQHQALTAFDGFTLIPAAGTITGTIRVYGWNNG